MDIKINYKGTSCRGTLFLYMCNFCAWEQEETHKAAEDPAIVCKCCGRSMRKKPTATTMDADLHDNGKSHNIGWDTE